MKNGYKEPSLPFKVPDSVIEKKINPATGKESKGEDVISEFFKRGNYNPNLNESVLKEREEVFESDSGVY